MSFVYVVSNGAKTSPAVDVVGVAESAEHSAYGPGRRIGYTIHYNLKGTGYFNGNIVKPGQGFLVSDGMYALHKPDKNDPWKIMWITLSGELCKEIFAQYNTFADTNIFEGFPLNIACNIADKITSHKGLSMDSFMLLEIFLQLHLKTVQTDKFSQNTPDSQIYLDYALKYITDNLCRPIEVEYLAKLIGISQSYLYKLFKQKFNISPKQYIMRTKLNCAKDMLSATNMSVTEIAEAVGYESVLAFSKIFSRKEGVSPQSFRNGE